MCASLLRASRKPLVPSRPRLPILRQQLEILPSSLAELRFPPTVTNKGNVTAGMFPETPQDARNICVIDQNNVCLPSRKL